MFANVQVSGQANASAYPMVVQRYRRFGNLDHGVLPYIDLRRITDLKLTNVAVHSLRNLLTFHTHANGRRSAGRGASLPRRYRPRRPGPFRAFHRRGSMWHDGPGRPAARAT